MDRNDLRAFPDSAFSQVAAKFEVLALADDGLTLGMTVGDGNLRPGGTISGPTMFSLADVAFCFALLSGTGPDRPGKGAGGHDERHHGFHAQAGGGARLFANIWGKITVHDALELRGEKGLN